MGERKPDVLCAQACEHLSRQEYQLALQCCDEILAGLPGPSSTPCLSSPTSEHSVRLQVLLYRVYALIQLKKFTEAEEDSSSVMCLQRELGGGTLKDLLVSMLLDGRLRGMCQSLFTSQTVERTNEDNMKYFRQLVLLLTELQVSCGATRISKEAGREGGPEEWQWVYRDPPRGVLGVDEYSMCLRFLRDGDCTLGDFCVSAHSQGELQEWTARLACRRVLERHANVGHTPAGGYGESLVEKWMSDPLSRTVVASAVPGVTVICVPDLLQVVREKHCSLTWILQLYCDPPRVLRSVSLLTGLHRPRFTISEVAAVGPTGPCPYAPARLPWEWTCGSLQSHCAERVYRVTLRFSTCTFGSFQQPAVFDFGSDPVLLQTVQVDLASPEDTEPELPQPAQEGSSVRWDAACKQVTVVAFLPHDLSPLDQSLLQSYQIPAAADQLFTRSVLDRDLTPHNYHARLHDLLYIEENAQYRQLCRFNLQTRLCLTMDLSVAGLRRDAEPLLGGQLFAQLSLRETGAEPDTALGRLLREAVGSVLLLPEPGAGGVGGRERVYEARVEACGPEDMLLRLSEECCRDLELESNGDLQVELQFQLNRLPLCEMHYALDSFHDCSLLFPELPFDELPDCAPSSGGLDVQLNEQQWDALRAIVTAPSLPLPPILLCGPPGSGKTFTLLKAIATLLKDDTNRVLLCTQSDAAVASLVAELVSSAELVLPQGWLLRLSGHSWGLRHCAGMGALAPGKEEVEKSLLVVSTLRQAKHLIHLQLDLGFFTHIMVDDASSSPECMTLMALSLANRSTRVVLAGDTHQLPPLMHSEFACERDLQRPLLDRLCRLYPPSCSYRVQLMEQYRTQHHIVGLLSEVFYGGQLKAGSKQPTHKDFFPLSFFVAWGTDRSSCGYYNQAEVLELAEQVESLCRKWPVSWGKLERGSVGVLTPYVGQARQLRCEMRRRNLNCVVVETLLAPSARPFRALFLSTVRTRHSCRGQALGGGALSGMWRRGAVLEEETAEDQEQGFLSSPRALHSAMLRAQSLLAIVGDPVALCTVGKCRRVWEHFLRRCAPEGGLQGASLTELLDQMDAAEANRACVLNPLAPEFVPRTPPRRTPSQSACITVKRTHPQYPKQPSLRERYGSAVSPGSPPFLLSSGRPYIFGRSPVAVSGSGPSCSPYSSRLLRPFPLSVSCMGYGGRVPVDPQALAGQAVLSYNLSLLGSSGAPPAVLSPYPRPSPLSCRSTLEGVPCHARAGRSEWSSALHALQLWGDADGCEQARLDGTFDLQWNHTLPLQDICQTSTPKSLNLRASWRSSLDSPLRDSSWSDQTQNSGGLLHSPSSRYGQWEAPSVLSTSRTIGPLGHESLQSPVQWGDVRGPGTYSVFSREKLWQHLACPDQNPSFTPGMKNMKASSQLYRMETCPSLSPPCSPLLESDLAPSLFNSPPAFQVAPQKLFSQPQAELYSSPRLSQAEHVAGGRRLYQRSSTLLHPPGESPQAQTECHSGSISSQASDSAWERDVKTAEELGHGSPHRFSCLKTTELTEIPGASDRSIDPLGFLQEICQEGGHDDSTYYSYFQ